MKTNLILNPFNKIAGLKSLLFGFGFMLASGVIGYFSKTHFDGILNVHSGFESGFFNHLTEPFINWTFISIWFYFWGMILSKSKIRAIDVFGTQAFAFIPMFPTSFTGFFKVLASLAEKMSRIDPSKLTPESITPDMLPMNDIFKVAILGLFMMAFTVWSAIWIYNAFKISTNLPNTKVIPVYIAGIILSMIVPKLIIKLLI